MIVDGRAIANAILAEVKKDLTVFGRPLRLGILYVTPDFATQKFIAIKEKRAAELGVDIVKKELPAAVTTEEAISAAQELSEETDGVIVQLPLSYGIDIDGLLNAVPPSKDVDGISEGKVMLSPVVAAIREILLRSHVDLQDKKIVIVGQGRLVGIPAGQWLQSVKAQVSVVTETDELGEATRDADIIILGVGKSGLLTPEMIKDGVVIIDAGTSEASGKLVGDADTACSAKASVFTPVPGGVGPIAVAMIFKNLLTLAQKASPMGTWNPKQS